MFVSALGSSNARAQRTTAANSTTPDQMPADTILQIEDLYTQFHTDNGIVRAVDGVSLSVKRQKVLGLVGESGCGKSMTALSIMQLVPEPHGRIASGQILFNSEQGVIDIAKLRPKSKAMRSIRGNEISMIFQGTDDFSESGTHRRCSDRRSHRLPSGCEQEGSLGRWLWICWPRSEFPAQDNGPGNIPTK